MIVKIIKFSYIKYCLIVRLLITGARSGTPFLTLFVFYFKSHQLQLKTGPELRRAIIIRIRI